ncbi:MAG: Hint domain-containing protein [Acetobacteraceae bacterium]
MTKRTWTGSAGDSWFTDTSWDPNGVPVPGDEAVIATGTVSVTGAVAVDGVQITLGSGTYAHPAHLVVNGGTIGATTTITVGRGLPYADLALRSDATFAGTVNVTGGQFSYFADTALANSGTVTVEKGGTANITGLATVAAPAVTFLDDNGTVVLSNPPGFAGTITGLRAGDRIELGHGFLVESTSYNDGKLTLLGQDNVVIATIDVALQGAPVTFYALPFGHGASAVTTSQENRTWGGSTGGDWYDPANWTDGVPLGGDTASILAGTAVLSEADAVGHGTMDFETVLLGAAGSFAPVTLQSVNASFGAGFNLTALGTPQYTPSYIAPQATFVANGFTQFGGNLSAMSHGGTLTVQIGNDGTVADFVLTGLPGDADADTFAEVFAGQESTLLFTGAGMLTNNGRVLIDGVAHFDDDVIIQGGGSIEIEAGGSVTIDGAVLAGQTVLFSDETGQLTINDIASFKGEVMLFGAPGDAIDIAGVQAGSLAYDTSSHMLSLLGQGGATLGAFEVRSTLGLAADDFALSSDGGGGSLLTYTPDGPLTMRESLPIAAVGTAASTIPLSTLLTQAFGAVPSSTGYSEYILSAPQPFLPAESYWQQGPYQTVNSAWWFNGAPIQNTVTVAAADIGNYSLLVGNSIVRTAWFTVPNAMAGNDVAQYVQYNIWTVDPSVNAPETAYPEPDPSIPDSGTRFGQVLPDDIVSSALRYNDVYNGVFNSNNCNWIADNLTAGAGAVMPYNNASTDPTDNQEGGFWRIVYRGSDQPNPVADWYQLTQPGDVVRMGRIDGGGQHTTTVLSTVNPDGTITVYDNGDHNAQGQNIIGIHDPTYWTGTDPASITIYRLNPLQQYLITGSGLTEYLQGSVYNDLIRPSGGADTIVGGPGNNTVQGLVAQINGISVTDFDGGDTLDLTDLAPDAVSADYDAATGVLGISAAGTLVATVALPEAIAEPFLVFSDGTGGTYVTLPCFAEGTRIATPSGPVPVQCLAEGDLVLTASGDVRPVVWLGHRHVACARHPRPSHVLPVRIAAGAFGDAVPSRDLLLSPDHAVFVNGVLIPVKYLINGTTVAQIDVAEITYWHVELRQHDVLLAEGLPAESYLDNGGRANFANGGGVAVAWPDFSSRVWDAYGCAPLCVTGPVLEATQAWLRYVATGRDAADRRDVAPTRGGPNRRQRRRSAAA